MSSLIIVLSSTILPQMEEPFQLTVTTSQSEPIRSLVPPSTTTLLSATVVPSSTIPTSLSSEPMCSMATLPSSALTSPATQSASNKWSATPTALPSLTLWNWDDVPSGLVIDSSIELAVVSAEQDQIMVSDSKSIIKIVALDASSKVSGQNTDTLTQGRANFTNTLFTAAPGRRGVKFRLVSSAIDYTVIQHLDPVKYADQIVTVNFRWCKPGEIQIGNICSACSAGSYSVTWNATQCKP